MRKHVVLTHTIQLSHTEDFQPLREGKRAGFLAHLPGATWPLIAQTSRRGVSNDYLCWKRRNCGAPGATRTPDLWFRSSGSDVTRRGMERAQVIRPTRNRWLQAGREVILTRTEKQALIWARMAGLRHNLRHTRSRRLFCPATSPNHCPRGPRGGLVQALGCARPKNFSKKSFAACATSGSHQARLGTSATSAC